MLKDGLGFAKNGREDSSSTTCERYHTSSTVKSKKGLSYKTLSCFRMLPEISNLTMRHSQSAKGKINIVSRRPKKICFFKGER